MKKLVLASAIIPALLLHGIANATKSICTQESLRSIYRMKQVQGEDTAHLQKKLWWNACPLAVRKAVYASLNATQSSSSSSSIASAMHKKSDLPILGPAPELQGLGNWHNSAPLTIAGLRGKVVLIHFWTFECINCIHTLPTIQGYWDKYGSKGLTTGKDKPFVVIGVHTPEFTAEKLDANLTDAIQKRGLTYPIVQDNDFKTWNAFGNQYWPAAYIIDAKGNIRYEHFGEGEYDAMDKVIHNLLGEISA